MIDPLVEQIVALSLALLFFAAATHKAFDISRFRQAVRDYQVLPPFAVAPLSFIVPVSEFFLAGCWLFHVQLGRVAIASIVLLATYTVSIAINLARGRVFIDCGCGFGASDDSQPISSALLVRNGVLMLLAGIPLIPASARTLYWSDHLVTAVVLSVMLLIFATFSQLVRNRAAIRSWRDN